MQLFGNADHENRNVGPSSMLFVWMACLCIVFLLGACDRKSEPAAAADPSLKGRVDADIETGPDAKVLVTYFYTTYRCPTCKLLEERSRQTVEKNFAGEVEEGTVSYRVINVDESENKHFVEDYGLVTKSLIVSMNRKGAEVKWKNLPDIWKHVRNPVQFDQYVKEEIESFLKGL